MSEKVDWRAELVKLLDALRDTTIGSIEGRRAEDYARRLLIRNPPPPAVSVADLDARDRALGLGRLTRRPGDMADAPAACDHKHTLADPRCIICGEVVGRLRAVPADIPDAPAADGRSE